ncbi:hypothetical protein ACM66B_003911 [Microbotryomycetes sp. NB124-2]
MKQSNASYSSLASSWTQSTAPPVYTPSSSLTESSSPALAQQTKSGKSTMKRFWKTLISPAPESVPRPGETALDVINRLNKRHGTSDVQALHFKR